jgi:hypothetical protein
MSIINHVLPGEENGNTSWFYRQNDFERQEILRQVKFKRRHWPELGNGKLAKLPWHTYPHILPDGHRRKAYYEPIADEILNYLDEEKIAIHTETLNLKSSQAACLNFLFPFRLDLSLATRVFKFLLPGLKEVTGIDFEYTGPIEATQWLGEPLGGQRGQNRTSIDAAIFWEDEDSRHRVALVEWKYTERNFGVCSAFTNGSRAEREVCRSINVAEDHNPAQRCQLTNGKRHRSRRYWEHMKKAGISLKAFENLQGCPFQGPLYQLMRQFLLGSFMVIDNIVDKFEIVSMGFAGNKALNKIPKHLQPMVKQDTNSVVDIWNSALMVDNKLRHVNVEELMRQVDSVGLFDANWRSYITEWYGV